MGGKGRGGRARTQRKHFRDNRENVWKRPKPDPNSGNDSKDAANGNHWEPFESQSLAFNEYYKEQGIVTAEEWDTFIEVLRKPLPAAFRINSSGQFCEEIRAQLQNDFMKSLLAEVPEGDEAVAIRPLPWYPGNLAWHSNFSRMQLRKNQALERFHEFLKLENEIGNITRQEAVSMVPPLFLDVHPNHYVLDMCAAPGSKTFQLLEIIHQSRKPGDLPDGLVVANDLDVQRCNLLIHQTKRMCTANLIVTNHEAQHFPGCRANTNFSNASAAGELKPHSTQLTFDRVLCDVPCSGDGTLRKAPDIWRKWNSGNGNGLHGLQVQIGMRGASLLKVGGRMVYSTCSMNPVENEAVVAELLRKSEGSLELVDVSNELPELVRRPGLKKWRVRDKGVWLASYKQVTEFRQTVATASMFPSGRGRKNQADNNHNSELGENHLDGSTGSSVDVSEATADSVQEFEEEVCEFPIERCMRIVPHDQNSGAFFIAVLHKVAPLPAATEKPSNKNSKSANDRSGCKLQQANTDAESGGINATDEMDESPSEVEINTNNQGDSNSPDNEPPCKLPVQDIKDADVLGSNAADVMDKQFSEGELEVNFVDNEVSENNLEITAIKDNSVESKQPGDGELDPKNTVKRKLQIQGKWKGVDPVVLFNDETVIDSIKSFYGINESFQLTGHLVTRNSDTNHVKRIYYISQSVKDVLELNFFVGQQLKITSIGLKMFERQSSREGSSTPCLFRISSEGLPVLLPYITKQILTMSPVDFKHLLQYKSIKYADFVDAAFGEKASNLMLGCCVIVLGTGSNTSPDVIKVDESTIAVGCWKGRGSLSVMVTAVDCQELLERLPNRLGNDL